MLDETLKTLLQIWQDNKDRKRKEMHRFLIRGSKALIETKAYLSKGMDWENIDARFEEAHRLSLLWMDVGIAAQPIDPDLAERFFTKANFWIDLAMWPEKRIKKTGIKIEQIEEEISKYFKGIKLKKKSKSSEDKKRKTQQGRKR
jgi:hypothetical protein